MHALRIFAAAVTTTTLLDPRAATPRPTDAAAPPGQLTSWGVKVGRASANDMSDRLIEWQALRKARAIMQLNDLQSILSVARQNQMMGAVDDQAPGEHSTMLEQWTVWYEQNILTPAARIAVNPAASCSESQTSLRIFYGLERQRQLLSPDPDDNDRSVEAGQARAARDRWNGIRDALVDGVKRRCRDEQLDECVATGRFDGVLSWIGSERRQFAIFPATASEDLQAWGTDVLEQCAQYDLRFRAVGNMDAGRGRAFMLYHVDRVIEGFFSIKFDDNFLANPTDEQTVPVLAGAAEGAGSPRLTLGNCRGTAKVRNTALGHVISCLPAAFPGRDTHRDDGDTDPDDEGPDEPSRAQILGLRLRHIVFEYIDHPELARPDALRELLLPNFRNGLDSVKIDTVDANQIRIQYSPAQMQAYLKWTRAILGPFDVGVDVWKDFLQQVMNNGGDAIFVDTTKREYPTLFRLDTTMHAVHGDSKYTDAMHFELVHRPRPKPFVPPPDPMRTPAQPGAAPPSGRGHGIGD